MTQRRLNTKISQNVAKPLKGRRPRKTGATCQRFAPPPWAWSVLDSGLGVACQFGQFGAREIHRTRWHDGGDGVLVDHLGDRVPQEHHILVKRLNLALQLDAIDQVNGHRHVLASEQIEERVL